MSNEVASANRIQRLPLNDKTNVWNTQPVSYTHLTLPTKA